jgi:hypothetical protein
MLVTAVVGFLRCLQFREVFIVMANGVTWLTCIFKMKPTTVSAAKLTGMGYYDVTY